MKFTSLSKMIFSSFLILLFCNLSFSQSTSWKGTANNKWRDASNWTNGIPDATKDAIIGDANFTGVNQPKLFAVQGSGECKTLTVGGVKASVLTVEDKLDVSGMVTITSNGTVIQDKVNATINLTGDWLNSGSFTVSHTNAKVTFSGTSQSIGGSSASTFEKLIINSGATISLNQNITINNSMTLDGTLSPSATSTVSGSGNIEVNTGGVLKVLASTFAGNYNSSLTINLNDVTSTIEYASSSINQSIATRSYNILKISGGMTKSLLANTTITNELVVNAGTLDLLGFTANRSTSGGSITLAAGTTLKIGSTNTFPVNYTTKIIASTSTVEYNGANQTLAAESYGNLTLSSSSGTVTKTMPATAMTIRGNLTTTVTAGTLSFTAGNNINVAGNITLASSSTFNGGTGFSHETTGNWINNGTYNGCNSSISFKGVGKTISGSGINNFGDMVVTGSGTVLSANASLTLCGNFSTSGGGSFTHTFGGTGSITMSGTSKSISGSNIALSDFIITGSISTTSSFTIAGNFTADGIFSATAGTINFSGAAKTIGGSATIQLSSIAASGSISTARNLLISSNVNVTGSFTASAGQVTFNGNSTLSGTANLYDVRITIGDVLTLGANSILGIANAVTFAGGATFNTSSNIPNTVNYNGTGPQSLVFTSYHNLTVSGGNVKTPQSGLDINGNLTIGTGTFFEGSSYSHTLSGDWINNGSFIDGTSTIEFDGTNDATITGATTFNNITINKGSSNKVKLINNIAADNIAMTSGSMHTESNAVTINTNRTGNGIILGTITRTHGFATATDYAFEGPNNIINFSSITGSITSITVVVTVGPNTTFPGAASINRKYNISVIGSSTYNASLRLHYEQAEINGNVETAMTFWNDGGVGTWTDLNKSSNDATNNWVELTGNTSLANTWTLSEGLIKYSWDGSADISWSNANNWTPTGIPAFQDVAYIGDLVFTNHPTISSTETIKKIYFSSTTASTLTFTTGANLTVKGNIDGIWTSDAIHIINVAAQTMTTESDIVLSAGVSNRKINLIASTGTINIDGSLTQTGSADITFSGATNMNIKGEYTYVSGTFTPSTSTVTFNGNGLQRIAGVTYYNLNIDKPSGVIKMNSALTVNNDLSLLNNSVLDVNTTLTVIDDITIGAGTTANVINSEIIRVGGDWTTTGTFVPGSGTVEFNGTGPQTVNATTFNNLTANKASGILTLIGDLTINGNVYTQSGSIEAATYNITRSSLGGTATLDAGTFVRFGGSGLQISNFANLIAAPTSTIEFYTASARIIPPITYGHLILSNGGSNSKTMVGPTVVAGNLTVNSGSTLTAANTTLTLGGNFIMNGTYNANNGTIILNGTSKTITGDITYNHMVVNGSYDFTSGSITFDGNLDVTSTGDFDAGSLSIISKGNFTNSGVVTSSGEVTFTGTQTQIIRLLNAITSTSTGIINFNGTVAPAFSSTSPPQYATVNINNTAPIIVSQPWSVFVAMNVASGATWNGGPLTHRFYRNFTNAGTVVSDGKLVFSPITSGAVDLGTNFTTTNTVEFGGAGTLTLTDNNPLFQSVIISNTNAAGVTPSSPWTVSKDVLIQAGATLHGAALSHTVSGKWTNNGTYNGQTSTMTFNSTSGTDAILGSGNNNFNNLNFAANTVFDVISDISVGSNLTNNATTLNFSNQEVKFNGNGLSVLDGAAVCNFHDLIIDKTSNHLRMDLNATVADFLILTNGYVDLNGNILSVTNPVSTAISRTSGYVLSENTSCNSVLSWTIGTDLSLFEFPFGNAAGSYIPFKFDLNSGDAGTVSVATYGTGTNNLPLPPTVTNLDRAGSNNSANVVDRFYFINLAGETSPNVDVTFSASASEVGSIASLKAQRWGINWEAPIAGQIAGATSVLVPGVTQFSPWVISGNDMPLPVTLLDFKGKHVGENVLLSWTTATEINNDRFELQKSKNGKDFVTIAQVKGAGNSSVNQSYSYLDPEFQNGKNYYKLKQVDFNGASSYSKVIAISYDDYLNNKVSFKVSPIPASDYFAIIPSTKLNSDANIKLINGTGVTVLNDKVDLNDGFKLYLNSIKSGVYVLQIESEDLLETVKVIVR